MLRSHIPPMRRLACFGIFAFTPLAATSANAITTFQQSNLVTDNQAALASLGFAPAANVDPNLINPWGMSHSATSPFWVSDQGTNVSTLYNGAGTPIPLVVSIPHAGPPAGPTGQVFNSAGTFVLPRGANATFLFANLDGTISGWNGGQGTTAVKVAQGSGVYTGLALSGTGASALLYAANNSAGRIDVFNNLFAPTDLGANAFVDPGANPLGLHPFNVANIGGHIFVTYGVPGRAADEAALGTGFVSEFNTDGTFIRRLADGDNLISPWGLEIAPSSFGDFAGALLVGNFSDDQGFISAYNLTSGSFLGNLADTHGDLLNIPYLWALLDGNGGTGGDAQQLYLAAGIGDEQHGLIASLSTASINGTAVPEPSAWSLMLTGFGVTGAALRSRRRRIAAV